MVDSKLLAVLYDLREHGAELPFFLEAKLGKASLDQLLEEQYLRVLKATPVGALVMLGPVGRQTLGLSPNYLNPPETEIAADQYLRRRCVAALRSKGWKYSCKVQGLRHVIELEHRDGRHAYLYARWKRISARSVRRVLEKLHRSLQKENVVLIVRTDRPHTLKWLMKQYPGKITSLAVELCRNRSE